MAIEKGLTKHRQKRRTVVQTLQYRYSFDKRVSIYLKCTLLGVFQPALPLKSSHRNGLGPQDTLNRKFKNIQRFQRFFKVRYQSFMYRTIVWPQVGLAESEGPDRSDLQQSMKSMKKLNCHDRFQYYIAPLLFVLEALVVKPVLQL